MKLVKITHKSGVAGRADPTAWDKFEIDLPFRVQIDLVGCFATVAHVYYKGKEVLFISEVIHKRLYSIVDRIYNHLWGKEYSFDCDYEYEPDFLPN